MKRKVKNYTPLTVEAMWYQMRNEGMLMKGESGKITLEIDVVYYNNYQGANSRAESERRNRQRTSKFLPEDGYTYGTEAIQQHCGWQAEEFSKFSCHKEQVQEQAVKTSEDTQKKD